MERLGFAAVVGAAVALACNLQGVFVCAQSSDCMSAGEMGMCESDGFCSFPDDACASGRRYGEFAGSGRALQCVPGGPGETDTATATSSASSDGGSGGTTSTSTSTSTTTSDVTTTTSPVDDTGEPTSTSSGSADATTENATDGSSTGAETMTVTLPATIAVCTDPTNNDPDLCEASAGVDMMSVDGVNEELMGLVSTAFVAFDGTAVPAGSTVVDVNLQLTVSDAIKADGQEAGEIWATEAFSLASLSTAQPNLVGAAALAASPGAVVQNEVVRWSLPAASLDFSGTVHVAVVPISGSGVDYWALEGLEPPILEVEVEVR